MDSQKLQISFFLFLLIAVGVVTFHIFAPFISVLALAAVSAVLFQPLYKNILSFLKGRETLAAGIVVIITALFIIGPVSFIGARLFNESKDLYFSLISNQTNYINTITHFVEAPIKKFSPDFTIEVESYIDNAFSWLFQNIGIVVSSTAHVIFNLFLTAVAFFFFLKDGGKFKKTLISLSPLDNSYDEEIVHKLEAAVNSVMRGTLLVAILQGILGGLGLFLFGVPNATLWGALTAIAALVPGMGTGLVLLPAVLYLYITGDTVQAIGLLVWAVGMVGTIDNFLAPWLYSKGVQVHPMLILFSVLGGLSFFGPIGFLFGPIVVSLFFTLLNIYKVFILKRNKAVI